MEKITNIIREVPAEHSDFSYYFDDDYINGKAGVENSIMYIIAWDRGRYWGINADEYNYLEDKARGLIDDFCEVGGEYGRKSYKAVMEAYGIKYSPTKCGKLKKWAEYALEHYSETAPDLAEYLTITTGRPWDVVDARGYYQGDYCEVLYCKDCHSEEAAQAYGEVFCGAAKEFCVIDLDENGEEVDKCYGFIVADCELKGYRDEEYKRIVCDWACLDEETTVLEMIDGYSTCVNYSYRVA